MHCLLARLHSCAQGVRCVPEVMQTAGVLNPDPTQLCLRVAFFQVSALQQHRVLGARVIQPFTKAGTTVGAALTFIQRIN